MFLNQRGVFITTMRTPFHFRNNNQQTFLTGAAMKAVFYTIVNLAMFTALMFIAMLAFIA